VVDAIGTIGSTIDEARPAAWKTVVLATGMSCSV
jgi:hypothetical protein